MLFALVGLVAVAGMIWLVARPKQGSIIVTVSGPGGSEIRAPRVMVNGELECEGSPCQVTGLVSGEHLVKVMAAGYQSSPAKTIEVVGGGQAVVEVSLAPSADDAVAHQAAPALTAEPAAAAPATAASRPADDTVDLSSLAAEEVAATGAAVRGSGVAARGRSATQGDGQVSTSDGAEGSSESDPGEAESLEPVAQGTLRINSIPPSRVVVGGRPRGTTPTVLTVPAGAQSVVFVHDTYGRKVVSVSVPAGGTAVASVTFP